MKFLAVCLFGGLIALTINAVFHPLDEYIDLCTPEAQAVWAIPCFEESNLIDGSDTPNCDILQGVQEMCGTDTVYYVSPMWGKDYFT